MILMFCIFKSLIGTDMTYHFSVDMPLRILSIYLSLTRYTTDMSENQCGGQKGRITAANIIVLRATLDNNTRLNKTYIVTLLMHISLIDGG